MRILLGAIAAGILVALLALLVWASRLPGFGFWLAGNWPLLVVGGF